MLTRLSPYALVPLRVFVGLALMTHGYPKLFVAERAASFAQSVAEMGFPLPSLFALLAGLSEFLGGFLLAVGLGTRWAALAIVATMGVAGLWRHAGDPFAKKSSRSHFCALPWRLRFLEVGLAQWMIGCGAGGSRDASTLPLLPRGEDAKA